MLLTSPRRNAFYEQVRFASPPLTGDTHQMHCSVSCTAPSKRHAQIPAKYKWFLPLTPSVRLRLYDVVKYDAASASNSPRGASTPHTCPLKPDLAQTPARSGVPASLPHARGNADATRRQRCTWPSNITASGSAFTFAHRFAKRRALPETIATLAHKGKCVPASRHTHHLFNNFQGLVSATPQQSSYRSPLHLLE